MRTFAIEYVDNDGEVKVVEFGPHGVTRTASPTYSIDFQEPELGTVGVSLVVDSGEDFLYDDAVRTTYLRFASLRLKEDADSWEVADSMLAEDDLYHMVESIYQEHKKEFSDG